LHFHGCRVPASALLGDKEGAGFANAMMTLDRARPGVAAQAVGPSVPGVLGEKRNHVEVDIALLVHRQSQAGVRLGRPRAQHSFIFLPLPAEPAQAGLADYPVGRIDQRLRGRPGLSRPSRAK